MSIAQNIVNSQNGFVKGLAFEDMLRKANALATDVENTDCDTTEYTFTDGSKLAVWDEHYNVF